jgi:hypothetical protein
MHCSNLHINIKWIACLYLTIPNWAIHSAIQMHSGPKSPMLAGATAGELRTSQRQAGVAALGLEGGGGTMEVDHINALPDDLLHLVLVHLECSHEVAQTSVLARRWRGQSKTATAETYESST